MKKIKRIISAIIIAAMLSSNFSNIVPVNAATQNIVGSSVDTRPDSEENIWLDLGTQTIVSDGVYSFGNAVVTGEDIRSIIVMFTLPAESGDSISLPSVQGINLMNGTSDYKIISIDENIDTETVQEYIRNINICIGGTTKDVQIILSKSTVDRNTYYNPENRHYYQYVSESKTWIDAYNAALLMSFAGREGYLATITNESEDVFVIGTTNYTGWVGGTRLPMNSNGTFNTSRERLSSSQYAVADTNYWYWACGPEKDSVYYRTAACSPKPYSSYTGWLSDFVFCCDHLDVEILSCMRAYTNWNHDDDNQGNCEPSLKANGELGSCMIISDGGSSFLYDLDCSWKAKKYADTYGFYVEYGDQTVGDSGENCSNSHTVTIQKMSYEAKPYISIDYTNELLTGFSLDKVYTINGEIVNNISAMGTVPIKEEWYGNDAIVVVKGDGSLTADSSACVVEVPIRPAAPTGVYGYNRSLTGVHTGIEYRVKGSEDWIKVTSTKVQRLMPGIYELRVSASNTSFVSDISEVEVLNSGAEISINVNKKVDVALALGTTGVDYSNFETDLRNYIMTHPEYSSIKQEDLNIMATNAVDTSGKSEFEWLQFDHSDSSSYYNNSSKYPFVENIGSQNDNGYNGKDTHIEEKLNGTQLVFYGYGSSPYADFMILENDQQTKKSFEFALKEYFAADALYGTGFFFNCNMSHGSSYSSKEAAYKAGALYMSGYLAVIEYGGKTATGLKVYQFENLNLKTFHHNNTSSGVYDALKAASPTDTPPVLLSNDVVNATAISGDHDLRKFRIDVTPSVVKIYYAGFDDTTHTVSSVTSESAASSFNTESTGYKNFVAQSYEDLPLVYETELPKRYGGSDFGPMTKYGSHNCNQLTKVEMSELSMTMDVVRSLSETLREPKWRDNTDKFLINLNEDPINDFANVAVTAELLNRLQNDDIYYIGWCGDENAGESQKFLNKNNLKGGIVNINSANFDTYDEQIAEIARLIYTRYYSSSKTTDVVITDAEKQINISNADRYNTADADFPEGKWRIDYYDDFAANNIVYSQTLSDFACDFDEVGVYKIYYSYMDGDQPIKTVTVHSKPEASITSFIDKETKTAEVIANVFDADGNDNEEFGYKWTYKDLGTADALVAEPISVELGSNKTETITELEDGHMYIITLEVTDKFGEKVTISRQISYNEDAPEVKIPPTAFFTLTDSKVITNGNDVTVGINDTSYDPAGETITDRAVVLYDAAGNKLEDIVLNAENEFVVDSNMTSGDYAIGLTVTSTNGTSNEIKRFFSVINDSVAPVGNADMVVGEIPFTDNNIIVSFTDEGGSGFKRYRYCVTNNSNVPSDEMFGQWSQVSVLSLEFPNENGTYYIHYQVEDYAGNASNGCIGGFERTQYLETPTKLEWKEQNAPVLVWDADERIDGNNPASYSVIIFKDGKFFAEINGLTENTYTAANIVRGGEGVYTYTVRALCDGNPSGSGEVTYFSSEVSNISGELNYVRPQLAGVNGGKLDLSEPITQEKIDEVFNGFAELVSTEPIIIKINNDIVLEESIEIDESITLDLNGHTVKGPSGKEDGESGDSAIKVTKDNLDIDLIGGGSIVGGDGANGSTGGNGGAAIDFGNTNGGKVNINDDIDIIGGNGGAGVEGAGGNGGDGINGVDVDVTSKGNITGGNGGNGVTAGGNGGNAVDNGDGDCTLLGNSTVTGGNGGNGNAGGNGGNAIISSGGIVNIGDSASVNGGDGGDGHGEISGNGGNGGAAVQAEDTTIINKGSVSGGSGGSSEHGSGGNGGAAFDNKNGVVNDYSGATLSGAGGDGVVQGLVGVPNQVSNTAPGGVLNGPLDINEEMSEEEALAAVEQTQDYVDAVFGEGNAFYNPITNTIILYKDVQVENPIIINKDVNIDLNGFTLSGADGTAENPDGKTAIVVNSNDVDIEVSNSRPEEGGELKGGDGYDGTLPGVNIGEAGGNGGAAIDFGSTENGKVSIKENALVSGGDGGDSKSGQAGNGGNAINGDNVEAVVEGTVAGGNGGLGGLAGGNGGDALDVGAGSATIQNGTVVGGNGGSGDIGGNGGNAVAVNGDGTDESGKVTIYGGNSQVSGGNAGASFNGTEGETGQAVENLNGDVTIAPDSNGMPEVYEGYDKEGNRVENTEEDLVGIDTSNGGAVSYPVTQENLDEVFGKDNAEYDPVTNTIIIKDDIYLEDSIVINNDITIDLNGNDVNGPDGTEDVPDAPPVISVGNNNVTLEIKDSVGDGSVQGGKGHNAADNEAGQGGTAVDFGDTTGTELIINSATLIGGRGGDSASDLGGRGGSAVSGNNVSVDNSGSLIGGDGGYSSTGTGGQGGAAVTGDNADISSPGSAVSGNGGNSGTGNGGNGGTIFEGNNQQVDISGVISSGEAGDSVKDKGVSGEKGEISNNPNATSFDTVLNNEYVGFVPDDDLVPGTEFSGTITNLPEYSGNGFVEYPDSIKVTINGEELSSDEFTYNPETGKVTIPGDKVTGSVIIEANATIPESVEVTNEDELLDALELGIKEITVVDDVVLTDDVVIGEDIRLIVDETGSIDLGNNTLKVDGTLEAAGEINSENGGGVVPGANSVIKYTPVLPAEGNGYTVKVPEGADYTVNYGESFTFIVEIDEGYTATNEFKVYVNGIAVELDSDNSYTIDSVVEQIVVIVEGVADITAPDGTILVHEYEWKNEFITSIIFDVYFVQPLHKVTIIAEDKGSGVKNVWYIVVNNEMTLAEIEALPDSSWNEYAEGFELIESAVGTIVYAKIKDYDDNIRYISSNGLSFIAEDPVIEGTDNYGLYDDEHTLVVNPETIKEVVINGEVVAFDDEGEINITEPGAYNIVVIDKAGNTSTYDIRVLGEDDYNGIIEEKVEDEASYIYDVGTISIEIVEGNEEIVEVFLPSSTDFIESILSEEDFDKASKGANIDIRISFDEEVDKISSEDVALIEKLVANSDIEEFEILKYIDIAIEYSVDGVVWYKVTEANGEIEFTIILPEKYLENIEKLYMVRCHDGKVDLLSDLDLDNNTITIRSALYSTYAIVKDPKFTSYELVANDWIEANKDILNNDKIGVEDVEDILSAMEAFDKLPEKSKEVLLKDDIKDIIGVFEFVVEYADVITKPNVTYKDLEELKDAMDSLANLTDSMKDLLDTDVIQGLEDKQKDAQEQMDNINDVGAGYNKVFVSFMIMLLCLSFVGVLTISGKKLKLDLIK